MIADLFNGLLGLLLIYVAILREPVLQTTRGAIFEAVIGGAIALLAAMAIKSRDAWYSRVLVPLGIALTAFALLTFVVPLPPTLESWFVFWIGVFTAVIAFWGLFYPHALGEPTQKPD